MADHALADMLPLWRTFREGNVTCLLTPGLDYVGALDLGTVDTRFVSDETLAGLGEAVRNVLGTADDGTVLHFLYRADVRPPHEEIEEYRQICVGASHPAARAYVDGRLEWLGGRALRRTRLYLFFSQDTRAIPALRGVLGGNLVYALPRRFTEADHRAKLQALADLRDRLVERLRGAGIRSRELTLDDVWRVHYELLNPNRAATTGVPPRAAPHDDVHSDETVRRHGDWLREYTEAELLCHEDLQDGLGHLRQGQLYRRVHTLKVLPEGHTRPDDGALLLRGLRDGDAPLAYTMAVTVAVRHQGWAKRALNMRHKTIDQMRKALPSWMAGGASVEQQAQEAAQQGGILALFQELQERALKISTLSVSILIDAPSIDVLNRRSEAVRTAVQRARSAQVQEETWTQMPAFLSMMPTAGPYQLRRKGCTSANAADLLPIAAPWRGNARAASVFETPEGDVVRFDPFDTQILNSHHAVFVADTGSGKSFTIGGLICDAIPSGVEVVMIDDGWSWQAVTEVMGGVHVPIDLSTSVSPFLPYPEMLDADGAFSNEELDSVVRFVEVCVQDPTRGPFDNIEKAALSKAVKWAYETRFKERPEQRPLIGDFDEALRAFPWTHEDDKRIAEDLRRRLEIFTTGIYSKFLNQPSTLRFDSPLLTFEMSRVGDNPSVRAIAMATMIQAISGRARRRRKRTIVAVDEMHKYLRDDNATARYFEYAWRTMRKYGVSMWAATQDLGSMLRNEAAKDAILNNSNLRFFLRHMQGKHRTAVDYFKLPPRAANAFESLAMKPGHYSDVMLMYGPQTSVLRLQVTPLAYWLLTTDPQDKALLERARQKNPTLDQLTLLTELAARYPHGAVGARAAA